jgi:hypothetical protein
MSELQIKFMLVVKADRRSQIWDLLQWMILSIYLILPAALGHRIYSASNRDQYQRKK